MPPAEALARVFCFFATCILALPSLYLFLYGVLLISAEHIDQTLLIPAVAFQRMTGALPVLSEGVSWSTERASSDFRKRQVIL